MKLWLFLQVIRGLHSWWQSCDEGSRSKKHQARPTQLQLEVSNHHRREFDFRAARWGAACVRALCQQRKGHSSGFNQGNLCESWSHWSYTAGLLSSCGHCSPTISTMSWSCWKPRVSSPRVEQNTEKIASWFDVIIKQILQWWRKWKWQVPLLRDLKK